MAAKWWREAAVLYVDMERGLYPWEGSTPRHRDGRPRVVYAEICKALRISARQSGMSRRVWNNPEFLGLVDAERRRRDLGIGNAVAEIEAATDLAPIREMAGKAMEKVAVILEREPDSDDPLALSPAQFCKEVREWYKLGLEVEGKMESARQHGLDQILSGLYANQQVTGAMVEGVGELLRQFRAEQDQRLEVIEGSLVD